MRKLHILGIAGTFMGGVAVLARELGHVVEGSDQAIDPPMSTQLETLGIPFAKGYLPENISGDCDEIVVGNALSRGNAAVEAVLDEGRKYTSGAQWLADVLLHYAVPLAALLWWLVLPPRLRIDAAATLRWLAWPAAYAVYALVRGAISGFYPYPYIDVPALGLPRVLLNAAALMLVFVLAAYLLRALAHWRQRAGG